MIFYFFHEFMHDRNTGQFYAMNSGLQVNRLGGIRMMITPDVNFKSCVTCRAVQRNCFAGKFWYHGKDKLLDACPSSNLIGHIFFFNKKSAGSESEDFPKSSDFISRYAVSFRCSSRTVIVVDIYRCSRYR